MSPVSGWKFHKTGECPECGDAEGALHVPVLEGYMTTAGMGREVIRGNHLPHFDPICKTCTKRYSLDVLCQTHKIPIRVDDARCKLCPS